MIKNKLDIIWYEFNSEREDIFRNCMYFHQQLYFKMARIRIDSENNSRNILSMLKSRIDEGTFIFRFVQPLPRNRRSLITLILRKGETVSGCEHHNQNSSRYLRRTYKIAKSVRWVACNATNPSVLRKIFPKYRSCIKIYGINGNLLF